MIKKFTINEEDKKHILGLYGLILEDDGKTKDSPSYYRIPGGPHSLLFFIINGKIYPAVYDRKTKSVRPLKNFSLNGTWEEFKVKLTRTGSKVDVNYTKDGESKSISVPQVSGEIIDNGFALNAKSMIDYVDEIDNEGDDVPDWGVAGGFYTQIQKDYKPSVQGTFQFLAITPTGFRLKNEGQPQVFTAKVLVNKVDFWESQGKTETTEDMVISPTTYQRVGKFGKRNKLAYALKFYDSPNAAYMDELGSDEGGGENVEPIRINVNLTVTDPFKFDKTEFYPETEESLKNFVNEMNGHINNPQYGQKFKEFLSQNPIKVYAYASIDAKSDEISQGRLPSCQNSKQTKAQYNLCLSQARADVVKKYLEDNLEGITVNAIGKGETDKFAPGKKFPNSNTEETKPNRAVVITLPEFRTTIE